MNKSFVFLNYIFSILKDISGITDYQNNKEEAQKQTCDYLSGYQKTKLIRMKERLKKIEL